MKQKIKIGLIGLGVVGEGVYQLIQQANSIDASIVRIAIKDQLKTRNVPSELITFDIDDIIYDNEIDVVIELIDDAETAFKIVLKSLQQGKHVISANKKMIAQHLEEIIAWQEIYPNAFLYEAAVCGSIPIIQTLETYFKHHTLHSIQGIVNGSTNYILSKQVELNISFNDALEQAQDAGFAESDPTLDIEGYDAVNKLCLLIKHGFGVYLPPDKILRKGIKSITTNDIEFAKRYGYTIKLKANAFLNNENDLNVYVLPQFISTHHLLANVENENNAIIIDSEWTSNQFFVGKGAGRYPTSSAVISDLIALTNEQYYSYHQSKNNRTISLNEERLLHVYLRLPTKQSVDFIASGFEHIETNFIESDQRFIIGLISIKQLLHSTWLHDEAISLICLPNEFKGIKTNILQEESVELV